MTMTIGQKFAIETQRADKPLLKSRSNATANNNIISRSLASCLQISVHRTFSSCSSVVARQRRRESKARLALAVCTCLIATAVTNVSCKGLVGKLPGNPASCPDEPCNSDPQHVLHALKWMGAVFACILLLPVFMYYLSKLISKIHAMWSSKRVHQEQKVKALSALSRASETQFATLTEADKQQVRHSFAKQPQLNFSLQTGTAVPINSSSSPSQLQPTLHVQAPCRRKSSAATNTAILALAVAANETQQASQQQQQQNAQAHSKSVSISTMDAGKLAANYAASEQSSNDASAALAAASAMLQRAAHNQQLALDEYEQSLSASRQSVRDESGPSLLLAPGKRSKHAHRHSVFVSHAPPHCSSSQRRSGSFCKRP